MKDIRALMDEYAARGGKVQRIGKGKRALVESYMRDITGEDDDRRNALERLADKLERKAKRKAVRKVRRDYAAQARYDDAHGTINGYAPFQYMTRES